MLKNLMPLIMAKAAYDNNYNWNQRSGGFYKVISTS